MAKQYLIEANGLAIIIEIGDQVDTISYCNLEDFGTPGKLTTFTPFRYDGLIEKFNQLAGTDFYTEKGFMEFLEINNKYNQKVAQ